MASPLRMLLAPSCALSLVFFASSAGAAQTPTHEWKDYAGGPDSSRFFAAAQITKANADQLKVAWTYADGQTGSNPIVARGVVYARGRNNSLAALDAATGRQLWIREGLGG